MARVSVNEAKLPFIQRTGSWCDSIKFENPNVRKEILTWKGGPSKKRMIILFNASENETIYIGGSDVEPSNGMPIKPNQYFPFMLVLDKGQKLYGITDASTTADLRVFEMY